MVLVTARKTIPVPNLSSGPRSATRWYRVVTVHSEMLYTSDGDPIGEGNIVEGFNLEVASGGYFGWGEQAAINAHVEEHYSGYEVVDTWPLGSPPAVEL